jgi:hypothetical protein
MKRASTSILSIFMVIAILVNTAGVTVYNHFCTEENETTLSFTKLDNCCKDKHPSINKEVKHDCCAKTQKSKSIAEIKKPVCCSQDAFTAQWKLNEFSFKKIILISSPIISVPVIIPEFKLNLLSTDLISEINSPPLIIPPADILHLHSVLII